MTARECAIVTGAGGFVGSHLIARLATMDIPVVAITRRPLPSWRMPPASRRVNWIVADITDPAAVRETVATNRPSLIFHLAAVRAQPRRDDWSTALSANVSGTVNLLNAVHDVAPDIRAFVNTGSSDEYGGGVQPLTEDCAERPRSAYAWSKTAAVRAGVLMAKADGLPVVTLRPFLIYGPAQSSDMFVPSLIMACLKQHDFAMTSGRQRRDFNYVEDVVDAYVLASTYSGPPGEIINIGSGKGRRIGDVADMIVTKCGAAINLAKGQIPLRFGEADLVCDSTKAQRLLGWRPKIELDEGLEKTIEWFRANLTNLDGPNG